MMTEAVLNAKIEKWLYSLVKMAARESYKEFLEDRNITPEEYAQMKEKIESTFKCKLYI
jgi:hypothetical protein